MKRIFIAAIMAATIITSTITALGSENGYKRPGVDYSNVEVIQIVQQALNDSGYDCGAPDGIVGPNTEGAISRYKNDHGLEDDVSISESLVDSLGVKEEAYQASVKDDLFYYLFLELYNKVGTMTYDECIAFINDNTSFEYEERAPIDGHVGEIHIQDEKRDGYKMAITTFPDDTGADTITMITYANERYESSAHDNYHGTKLELGISDMKADPLYKTVDTIDQVADFVYSTLTADGNGWYGEDIPEDTHASSAEDKADIESYIRKHVRDRFSDTDTDSITINDDYGTETAGDYIALVNLTWNVHNYADTTETMLQMYSNDLAACIAKDKPQVQEIAVFWKVPYLGTGTSKWSYERQGEGMYLTDKVLSF